MKLLALVSVVLLTACLEKNLENQSQSDQDYCSIYVKNVIDLQSDVTADFSENDVSNEVLEIENDCPEEITITNSYDKVTRSGENLTLEDDGYEEAHEIDLETNTVKYLLRRGGNESCQIAIQTEGVFVAESNDLVMDNLFEFLGNCF